jgi:flagellar protein FlaG
MEPLTAVTPAITPEVLAVPATAPVAVKAKVATPDPVPAQKTQPPPVEQIVKDLNDTMRVINTNIAFSVDQDTGKTVIKVVDSDTKKVIRQIPTEEMLRVASRLKELLGILFDKSR